MSSKAIRFLEIGAGTERWVQFARQRAVELDVLRRSFKMPYLTRSYSPEPGTTVWIKAGDHGPRIRITGGAVAGWNFANSVDEQRWYYIVANRLKYYNEFELAGDGDAALSLDGKSFAYGQAASPNTTYLSRRGRDSQEVTGVAHNSSLDTPHARLHDVRVLETGSGDMIYEAYAGAPGRRLSSDGTLFFALATTTSLPRIFELAQSQLDEESELEESEWSATQYDEAYAGTLPPFVTEFYASLPGHSIAYASGTTYDVSTPLLPLTTLELEYRAMFDHFSDTPVMSVAMPYVPSFTVDPVSGFYEGYLSVRYVVAQYDRATAGWTVVRSQDFPGLVYLRADGVFYPQPALVSAPWDVVAGTTQGIANLHYVGAEMGGTTPHQWTIVPNALLTPGINPHQYTYGHDPAASPQLLRDGAVICDDLPKFVGTESRVPALFEANATSALVVYFSDGAGSHPDDSYVGINWCGAWGKTHLSAHQSGLLYLLSPLADELWFGRPDDGLSCSYWRDGALVRDFGVVPTADSSSYADYSEAPEEGFHFAEPIGWSYKAQDMRAKIYRRIELTPANPGTVTHLYGGTINIPTVGSLTLGAGFLFNTGFADAAGTTVVGFVGLSTPADFDTFFGVSGTTFVPDGSEYDRTFGASAESYAWDTATALVRYDAESGAFRVTRTLSETEVSVPARGGEDATPPTAEWSEATLVQRTFVPHPVIS